MNYYDDILNKIYSLILEENFDEAKALIINELNVPYVPKDVEEKLYQYLQQINEKTFTIKTIADEDIEKYLYMDEDHQLLAVDELNKKNLRNYLDICNNYLQSNGFKNAKVLLIDSLIRQEISDEIKYIDDGIEYNFIPKYSLPLEQTDGFIKAKSIIDDEFMKNPSENKIALQLLYKDAMFRLPIEIDMEEASTVALDIIKYVYKAFNDEDGMSKYSITDNIN